MVSTPENALPDFDALWNYEQPAATEQAFLSLLERVAQTAPESYRLSLLTQIARTRGLQRRFDDAHRTLDEVESGLDETPQDEVGTPRVRYLLERGRVYNSAGTPDCARSLFVAAWEQASALGLDGFAVDAAHMLGIIEPGERGVEWNRRALALAQASPDPRAQRWQGSLYNNMGWSCYDAGDYEQALAMFESALAAWEGDGQTERTLIARWATARALRSLGRTQEALDRQLALLGEREAAGAGDGYTHEEIGECLLELGRVEESRSHFARAYAQLSQDAHFAEAEPGRLERVRALGGVDENG